MRLDLPLHRPARAAALMLLAGLGTAQAQTPAPAQPPAQALPSYMLPIAGRTASTPAETANKNILALNTGMFELYGDAARIFQKNILSRHPVILGLFSRWFSNDGVWKGTALMAVLVGAYDCASIVSGILGLTMPAGLVQVYQAIPLAATGFAWVAPSILGGIAGGLIWKAMGRSSIDDHPEELEAAA